LALKAGLKGLLVEAWRSWEASAADSRWRLRSPGTA